MTHQIKISGRKKEGFPLHQTRTPGRRALPLARPALPLPNEPPKGGDPGPAPRLDPPRSLLTVAPTSRSVPCLETGSAFVPKLRSRVSETQTQNRARFLAAKAKNSPGEGINEKGRLRLTFGPLQIHPPDAQRQERRIEEKERLPTCLQAAPTPTP